MRPLEIRPATLEDQEILFKLHEQLFREQIDRIWGWDDGWQLENFQREWQEVETMVIHEQGEFAGCLQTRDEPGHVYVMNLAIRPEFQNRGIGSEMIRRLQQRNLAVRLGVFRTNERALTWYVRWGFQVVEKTGTGFRLEWQPGIPDTGRVTFEPINLEANADLCVRFRKDSFFASFGMTEAFLGKDAQSPTRIFPGGESVDEYLEWLATRMREIPGSCVHVWQRGGIIGQIEMGRFRLDPSIGYVNLFYLIPECRGRGLGAHLDRFAVDFLRRAGHRFARLCMSPTNLPAVAFYRKHQWYDVGPRPDHPQVHYLEKQLVDEESVPADSDIA